MRRLPFALLLLACGGPHDGVAGQPCVTTDDCVIGTVCVQVDVVDDVAVTECATTCGDETDWRCDGGAICYPSGYPGDGPSGFLYTCFPGGRLAIGAACEYPTSCQSGLVCEVRAADEPGTCEPYCDFGNCREGEWCTVEEDCDAGLSCVPMVTTSRGWSGRCARLCATTENLCDGGELCAPPTASSSVRACYPGGTTLEGGACEFSLECTIGLACAFDGAGTPVCRRACNDETACDAPDRCAVDLCEAG